MPILFKPSAVKSHFDPSGKRRYIARPCKTNVKNTYDLSKILSDRSTLSSMDIFATLHGLQELIPELLLQNNSIHLEPLGVFSVSFKSDVEDEESGISAKSIKDIKLQFRPDPIMKSKLKRALLKKSK